MHQLSPARAWTHTDRKIIGVHRIVNVPAPAAATEWSLTVPGGVMWRLLTGTVPLTTSAAVGNRFLGVKVLKNNLLVYVGGNSTAVAASTAVTGVYVASSSPSTGAGFGANFQVPMPYLYLRTGDTIGSYQSALLAGDQYGAGQLVVDELYFTDDQLTNIEVERERRDDELREALAEYLSQQGKRGY